jgi:ATP-binding cassette, subfamily B (MDR/TAP), member 1
MFVIFCGYALAVWFGAKMIMEKGYNGGTVINVIIAVLTASMYVKIIFMHIHPNKV